MIVSNYQGYSLAAAVIDDIKVDPFVSLEKFKLPPNCSLQFIDTRYVYTARQLVAAFMSAVDAYMTGTSRARKIEIEILLRFSGRRQINEAIDLAGYKKGDRSVCLCVIMHGENKLESIIHDIANCLGGIVSSSIERGSLDDVLKLYRVSSDELECLVPSRGAKPAELLIIEKIVMSSLS